MTHSAVCRPHVSSSNEKMLEHFLLTAQCISENIHSYGHGGDPRIGLEIELPLVRSDGTPVPQSIRDEIVSVHPSELATELGAHQLEITNAEGMSLTSASIGDLIKIFQQTFLHSSIQKLLNKHDVHVARIGCLPWDAPSCVPATQGTRKYEQVPRWHAERQRKPVLPQIPLVLQESFFDPFVVGLLNAVHVNVDALNIGEAIEWCNRATMLSPYAIALSANAPFLSSADTWYCDVRSPAWEISHDVRTDEDIRAGRCSRVGLPPRYFSSLPDYLDDVSSYPFILDTEEDHDRAFDIGIGLYWRDARIKFLQERKRILVELRPISLQPSLEEDIAMAAFFFGRILWGTDNNEEFLPLTYVRENRDTAVRFGMNAHLSVKESGSVVVKHAAHFLHKEISRAKEGLWRRYGKTMDVDRVFLPLEERRTSPAEKLRQIFEAKNCSEDEAPRERLLNVLRSQGVILPSGTL